MLGLILASLGWRAKFWPISKRSNFGYKAFIATNSVCIWDSVKEKRGSFMLN